MPNTSAPHPDVSFSASAEDYIRRFMKVAEETMPNASLVPVIAWYISGKFTNKSTGEVTKLGPGVGVGAIDQKDLADELIVPMGGLQVAIRLPDELQSADIRFLGRFFCRRRPLMSILCFLYSSLRKIMSGGSWRRLGVPVLMRRTQEPE
jgi:hypothetical protein